MVKTNRPHQKSILNQTFWFLGAYAFFLISTISVAVYYIASRLETINQSVLALDELAYEVEMVNESFIRQAKDRKNLFLRGHKQKDRDKYWGRVNKMTQNIQIKVDEILENPLAEPYQTDLKIFLREHTELMEIYRQGLEIFVETQDYTAGDQFVRGEGGEVGKELTQVLKQIQVDRQKLLQDNKRHIRHFLFASTSVIIVIILICSGILVVAITNPMRRIVHFTDFLEENRQAHPVHKPEEALGNSQSSIDLNPMYQPLTRHQYDEIGYMIDTYNKLNSLICDYRYTLEQKVAQRTAELQEANQELSQLANLDGLTQIANRRRFDEYLASEWQRHLREQQPLSLILIDIDYFKSYNDYYGHLRGDDCLIRVARLITTVPQRSTDLFARYGGEEFAVILPNTNSEGALTIAESIQKAIAILAIPHAKSEVSQFLTLSLGVASLIPPLDKSAEDLIVQADDALYIAKKQGRNRIVDSTKLEVGSSIQEC